MACVLGAVSCCLECVPAQFHVVKSERFWDVEGFAGKRILEEEGGMRLTSSSILRLKAVWMSSDDYS
jgi:hypothetical protein